MNEVTNQGQQLAGGITGFIGAHPILTVLMVVGVLIVLLLLFRLGRAYLRYRHNNKEVASLKKDLMIWTVLSNLVQGGRKSDKAKAEINSRLAAIEQQFSQGLGAINLHRYFATRRPWYVLLGEPDNGKSSLILQSDLNFRSTVTEKEDSRALLRFHYNNSSVVVDVAGKIFFDNWIGGSGAEWTRICQLIKKKNHYRPLDGIILTISAEALLGDDHKLTLKKAGLIAEEMLRLTGTLCMYLPCYVVITKLDAVLGFREYFASWDDKQKNQIVGMQPTLKSGAFDADEFDSFFDSLLVRLHDGAVYQMRDKEISDLSYADKNRLTLTGPMLLFADNLALIRENLKVYLSTIFSREMGSTLFARFRGLYFTSALDKGFCLNERFAQLQRQSIDDAPLQDPNFTHSRSYFVTNLLSKQILVRDGEPEFTHAERVRRRIPFMAAAAVLVALIGVLWDGILVQGQHLENALRNDTMYYNTLDRLFTNSTIASSPLFSVDNRGNGQTMFDHPMVHDSNITRLNFYNDTLGRLNRHIEIPWQFYPAAWFKYDLGVSERDANRYFIANQLQTYMSYFPVMEAVEYNLLTTAAEPVSLEKRNAIFSLIGIAQFGHESKSDTYNDVYTTDVLGSFLEYLYPDLEEGVRKQVSAFRPEYDFMAKATNTAVILGRNYRSSCAASIRGLVDNWEKLQNYPLMGYSIMRREIGAAHRMIAVYEKIEDLNGIDLTTLSLDELTRRIGRYRRDVQSLIDERDEVDNLIKFAGVNLINKSAEVKGAAGSKKDQGEDGMLDNPYTARFAAEYATYRGLMEGDFDFLDRFNRESNESKTTGKNVHFGSVNFLAFPLVRDKVKEKLADEYELLRQTLNQLQISPLFAHSLEGNSASDFNYAVLSGLFERSLFDDRTYRFRHPREIGEALAALQDSYDRQSERLEDYVQSLQSASIISQWHPLAKNMLDAQYTLQRLNLLAATVNVYPATDSDLNLLSDLAGLVGSQPFDFGKAGGSFSLGLAEAVLGPLNLRAEYNPQVFLDYLTPVGRINSLLNSDKEQNSLLGQVVADNAQIQRLIKVMSSYATNFINYWGSLADSLHPSAKSFTDFYILADETKAYQVNAQLQDLYELSYNVIDEVDDSVLSQGAVNTKKKLLERLKHRLDQFSIDFTDRCADVLSAWSQLGGDPTWANIQVMQMQDKELKNNLLTLGTGGKGSSGSVPWWETFTKLGVRLLKKDAAAEARLTLEQYQDTLKHFPLMADADPKKGAYSRKDLKNILVLFRSYGLSLGAQDDDDKSDGMAALKGFMNESNVLKPEIDLRTPLMFSQNSKTQSDFKNWTVTVDKILSALTREKALTFSLGRVDPKVQAHLLRIQGRPVDAATGYYRYFTIQAGKGQVSRKFSTFAVPPEEGPEQLFSAEISSTPVVLNFYRFTDQQEPEATVTLDGAYPALQLYLSKDTDSAELENQYLAALPIKDKAGRRSIYYLSVSFSEKLPAPLDWPSTENWPNIKDFSQFKPSSPGIR
ncbi:MAG: hypothetical protein IJ228_02270 [Succinivibrio sp.]|nr:hypothetical protein [Succinivibrio sp.]